MTTTPDSALAHERDRLRVRRPRDAKRGQNVIERAVILTRGEALASRSGEWRVDRSSAPNVAPKPLGTLEAVERAHIIALLQETRGVGGGPNGAAARLGSPAIPALSHG